MKELLLIGGGGHSKACIDVIELHGMYKIAGIIDNKLFNSNTKDIMGYPILGTDSDLEKFRKIYQYAFVSIGQIKTPNPRIAIYAKLKRLNYILPIIISPLAHIAKGIQINEGTIVMHHALINSASKIGKMCIINTKALIEHDCLIQDFCHIATGAILNGGCIVGEKTFIGSNMTIKHNKQIITNQIIYFNPIDGKMGGGDNIVFLLQKGEKCA